MPDDLRPKVLDALRSTGERCETILPGSTDRFVRAIGPAFDALLAALDGFAAPAIRAQRGKRHPDHFDLSWHLLWDACNSLLAAFVLLQRGYETEAMAATRGVLERVACAMVLFDNPELLPRFKAEKLPNLSTEAIGIAGQVIPDLPREWGVLSRLGAHVHPENVGTSGIALVVDDAGHHLHMAIGGRLPTDPEVIRAWAEMVAELCVIAERILVEAPRSIYFNPRRKRATFSKSGGRGKAERPR